MGKLDTVNLKGNDYALVPTRLMAFREDNPRSLVETNPTIEGKTILFKARLVKDKSNPNSAEATGHSYGEVGQPKAFEKLETQAVGRALALLGYLNNGQVATTEEMAEFEEYRSEGYKNAIEQAETIEALMLIFKEMNASFKQEFTPMLTDRKKELQDAAKK